MEIIKNPEIFSHLYLKSLLLIATFIFLSGSILSQNIISDKNETGSFPLVAQTATPIYTDENDDWLIQKTALLLQDDIEKVTGKKPSIIHSIPPSLRNVVIIGSVTGSPSIKELIQTKKIKGDNLKGKWEVYQVQLIPRPFKGIVNALVIAGSDKRGAAYGVLELSKQLGVSPWYYWADVPVKEKNELYVRKNGFLQDHPLVKYRGIFINDEAQSYLGPPETRKK